MSLTIYEEANQPQPPDLAPQNVVYEITWRLMEQRAGTMSGGYKKLSKKELENLDRLPVKVKEKVKRTYDPKTDTTFLAKPVDYGEKGMLLYEDARYAVEFALAQGLLPFAQSQVQMYYMGGQLIVHPGYEVLIARAIAKGDFSIKIFEMNKDERLLHELQKGDLGAIAYLISDKKTSKYEDMVLSLVLDQKMNRTEAQRFALDLLAKSKAHATLSAEEMSKKKQSPKGRSWQFILEKRARTAVLRQTYGDEGIPAQRNDPGQAEVKTVDLQTLADSGFPVNASAEEQQRYLEMARQTADLQNRFEQTAPSGALAKLKENTVAMRGPGDDDEFFSDIDNEDYEDGEIEEPEAPEAPADSEAVEFRQRLRTKAQETGNNDPATDTQVSLVSEKLKESFAPDADAADKASLVLRWLFDATYPDDLTFSEAHALLGNILSGHDKETGDYPLKGEAVKTLKKVYRQAQIDAGQGELL